MPAEQLRAIREHEIAQVLGYLQPGQRVLEIGSGMGWQAQYMQSRGFKVIALEIPVNHALRHDIHYDGKNLPLKSASVDIVYTSNVLEHVESVEAFLAEMHRVLKPGGRAIHVLPTATWRWWTSLVFYMHKLHRFKTSFALPSPIVPPASQNFRRKRELFPQRHGTTGSSLSELYYFSRYRWIRLFRSTGWKVEHIQPNHLFYTGYSVLDQRISLQVRRQLSYFAGSACVIYVLGKT